VKGKIKRVVCLMVAVLIFFVAVLPSVKVHAVPTVAAPALGVGLDVIINTLGGVGVTIGGEAGLGCGHANCAGCVIGTCLGGLFPPLAHQDPFAQMQQRRDEISAETAYHLLNLMDQYYGDNPPPTPPPGGGLPPEVWLDAAFGTGLVSALSLQLYRGLTDVPFLSVETNAADLETLLTEARTPWQNLRAMQEAATAGENYFFCFFDQTMRPIPAEALRAFTPAPAPSHPLYIGTIGGLPIIQWSGNSQQMMDAQRQHAVEGVLVNGRLYSFGDLQNNAVDIFEDGNVIGTVTVHQDLWRVPTGFVGIYDAIYSVVNLFFIQHEIAGRSSWRDPVASDIFRGTNQEITPPITTTPDLTITTTTPNILDNPLDEVMEEIRRIADVNENDEPIVIQLPLLDPQFFPQIPEHEWSDFQREIEELLIRPIVILSRPEREALLIRQPNIPRININIHEPPPPPPPPPPFPEIDFSDILEILRGIIDVLRWIPDRIQHDVETRLLPPIRGIEDGVRDINEQIRDFFDWQRDRDNNDENDDTDDLDDQLLLYLPDMDDYDFRLSLIDYFPFSLPRDLYNAISIMLGNTPAALGGASVQERALFMQYINNEPLTAAEFTQIEPFIDAHFLTRNIPRFEIRVPMPSFSTGVGEINYTESEIVIEIDLAEYPTMIAIINWGVFVFFLIGLIFTTTKVITF